MWLQHQTKTAPPTKNLMVSVFFITMSDGFMAAVTLSGRSAEVESFSKMSSQERVAFAASDEKEWDAILSAGAVRI